MSTVQYSGSLVMLWGCFVLLWHWKPVVCGRQDGLIQVSGNPRRRCHVECETGEAGASLDLPKGQ